MSRPWLSAAAGCCTQDPVKIKPPLIARLAITGAVIVLRDNVSRNKDNRLQLTRHNKLALSCFTNDVLLFYSTSKVK